MKADDVRMTAQLAVEKRVHSVSDEAVEAMARRVLELEPIADGEAKRLLRMAGERNTWMDRAESAVAALADAVVALDAVRAVGVTVERREDGTGWAVTNTRAVEAEAAEREACAKVCDELALYRAKHPRVDELQLWRDAAAIGDAAVAIRARGAR